MSLKRKRNGTYSNSTGTLTWNPLTQEARSYGWYVLAKRINGNMVLNTYSYSNTTMKHVRVMREHLGNLLGVGEVLEIEAPKGLQDLSASLEHSISQSEKFRDLEVRARSFERRESYARTSFEFIKDANWISQTLRGLAV